MQNGSKFLGDFGAFLLLGCLAALVVGTGWLILPDTIRYALEYKTSSKDVFISSRPHDCDFWTAPLGIKPCHYKKEVTAVHWHPDPNRVYFKSNIEGPDHADAFVAIPGEKIEDTSTKVYVTWTKLEHSE